MKNIFRNIHSSLEDLGLMKFNIKDRMNHLNAKRASLVLSLGIFMELVLIGAVDIPNIIQNGFIENYGIHYLVLHTILLIVSLIGTFASRSLLSNNSKWLGENSRYDSMIWITSALFVVSIALINGLDQMNSGDTTLFVFFILVIALFVLLKPKHMLFVSGFSYIAFLIGQIIFQSDQSILFSNIVNGTLAVIVAFFMSYFSYHNFIEYILITIKLEETTKKLEILSVTDQLTKIYNRRKFDENIEIEIARSKRTNIPFSLLMLDIDHFKQINDTYGHQVGDEILIGIANYISQQIRMEDTFARYGGEEFVVILTGTTVEKALEKAEFICNNIRKEAFCKDICITMSIGVTSFIETDTHDVIVHRSDVALYEAKETGRNKVVVK